MQFFKSKLFPDICVPLLLYPHQDGDTPLHLALRKGHTTCVECLFSAPGIDINIKDGVSWSIEA